MNNAKPRFDKFACNARKKIQFKTQHGTETLKERVEIQENRGGKLAKETDEENTRSKI